MEQGTRAPETPREHDSLSPQTHRLSVEAEASLMSRGRGRQLLGIAGIAIGLGAVGVLALQHLARSESYASAAAAVADAERTHFERYFQCALPGATSGQLTSSARVHGAFERAGDRLGKRYAATLISCSPRLDDLTAAVEGIAVPESLAAQRAALATSVERLKQAQAAYQAYLDDDAAPYQFVTATPLIEKIALAYQSYREASAALSEALHEAI